MADNKEKQIDSKTDESGGGTREPTPASPDEHPAGGGQRSDVPVFIQRAWDLFGTLPGQGRSMYEKNTSEKKK